MKQLVIATHNSGKLLEFQKLLTPHAIDVLDSTTLALPDVEETGETFSANALLKAQSAFDHTGIASLADDSGLCVDALNGAPGIFTARYGGPKKLISELKNTPNGARAAFFECTLCLVQKNVAPQFFTGRSFGSISKEIKGEQGFGYDPVFIPTGEKRTYAEMTKEEKAQTSHRAKALSAFVLYLQQND